VRTWIANGRQNSSRFADTSNFSTVTLDLWNRDNNKSSETVLLYRQSYHIRIASYKFDLFWRLPNGPNLVQYLKDLAISDFKDSTERLEIPTRRKRKEG
jgi:hypothetical protein